MTRSPAILTKLCRLVKMSILVQFHQLALPGTQKQVVLWVGVFVFVFTLFTIFVSVTASDPKSAH